MKFTYSAFIENTPEIREWLKSIGWKEKYVQDGYDIIVCASNTGMFSAIIKETQDWFESYSKECIDCLGNPNLFKAVTAIREDSDKWQLFTDGVKWTLCYEESILMWRDIYNFPDKNLIHKATLSELKEHFNKGK